MESFQDFLSNIDEQKPGTAIAFDGRRMLRWRRIANSESTGVRSFFAARDWLRSQVNAGFRAGTQVGHPAIEIGMNATGAAQVLAFRAVGDGIVPWGELESGLAAGGVEGGRTLIGADPPLLFHAHLLLAADVTRKTFNPSH